MLILQPPRCKQLLSMSVSAPSQPSITWRVANAGSSTWQPGVQVVAYSDTDCTRRVAATFKACSRCAAQPRSYRETALFLSNRGKQCLKKCLVTLVCMATARNGRCGGGQSCTIIITVEPVALRTLLRVNISSSEGTKNCNNAYEFTTTEEVRCLKTDPSNDGLGLGALLVKRNGEAQDAMVPVSGSVFVERPRPRSCILYSATTQGAAYTFKPCVFHANGPPNPTTAFSSLCQVFLEGGWLLGRAEGLVGFPCHLPYWCRLVHGEPLIAPLCAAVHAQVPRSLAGDCGRRLAANARKSRPCRRGRLCDQGDGRNARDGVFQARA